MKVSLCVVAYNEENYLPKLLHDIKKQTYPHMKTEIVLVDSCSDDGTRGIMRDFQREFGAEFADVLVVENQGKTQSCGWNVALLNFTGDVIVRVDAHSHIPPGFLEKNVENLMGGEMVSGGARPALSEADSAWGNVLLMAEESMFGSSASSFRRRTAEGRGATPERRGGEKKYVKSFFHGAYRREVFKSVGGFREDLGRTEDNELHYRIRKGGFRLCMSPDIVSYQYIRPTLKKMCRQKFANGYWIGLTLGVCPGCLSLYHFVPGAFVCGIVFTSLLAVFGVLWPAALMWGMYVLLAAGMAVIAAFGSDSGKRTPAAFLLPVLFFLLHISYGLGTAAGIIKMPFWRGGHKTDDAPERIRRRLVQAENMEKNNVR